MLTGRDIRARAVRHLPAALLALLLAVPHAVGAKPPVREPQLKALFVYSFTKFIEWPAQAFASADTPIVIGVLGEGALGVELSDVVKGRTVNGRSVVVVQVRDAAQAQSVHVLFVSADELASFEEIRPAIRHSPILTIGESRSFALRDGAITFVMEEGVPRFEINIGSAERAGLKVSAQLQKLAKTVFKGS